MKTKKIIALIALLTGSLTVATAETDPNFYIYLCFGQSNMEGNAQWETVDNEYVDPRFQMLATTDFESPQRTLGQWYTAQCPIVSPAGKLGMADYFGRTMVAALPSHVKVGVIAVAMGGSPIEMFDKDQYKKMLADHPGDWWATLANMYYGGNPYGRLVARAKMAKKEGVIKGILLHQGCSNCGNPNWPTMVKKIYEDMLSDLEVQVADVPLFVGETEREDMGGGCSYHNTVVAKVPEVIPTAHVISSYGCPGNGTDAWHFSPVGYRMMGRRYAYEALKAMGLETKVDTDYQLPDNLKNFYTPVSFDQEFLVEPKSVVVLKLWCTFADGHREDLTEETTFSSTDLLVYKGKAKAGEAGTSGTVTATWTDFLGTEHQVPLTIATTGTNGIEKKEVGEPSNRSSAVFNLQGMKMGSLNNSRQLPAGLYVVNHKKVILK